MRIIAFIMVMVLLPLLATARRVHVMSSEEMFKKADLVAVCQPASIKQTAEQSVLTNITPQIPVIGLETTFNIRGVEKGDKRLKRVVLHHYRLADPIIPPNGPSLMDFDSRTNELFLLYLVKEPDGRFAPVTGQTDPSFSVINVPASNTAPEKFIGRWRAQNGLMGETDLLDLAADYTVRWEQTDSTFQPPAVTTLTGTWKQPDEFSYVVLELTNRVDHQGARLLESKHENKEIMLCLRNSKLQVFEGSAEFTRIEPKPKGP